MKKLYISTVILNTEAIANYGEVKTWSRSSDLSVYKISMIHYCGYTDQDISSAPGIYELHVPQDAQWPIHDVDYRPIGSCLIDDLPHRAYTQFMAQNGLPDEVKEIAFDDVVVDPLLKSNIIPNYTLALMFQNENNTQEVNTMV